MSKIKRIIRPMSRDAARKCIVCTFLSCGCCIGALFTNNALFVAAAIVFCVGALVYKLKLKCPYCGMRGPQPQWSKSGTIKCAKCKKYLEYDK